MTIEILTIIISGVVSLIASLVIATLRTRGEFKKLEHEVKSAYANTLFEKRTEVYRELYQIITDCNSQLEQSLFTQKEFSNYFLEYDNWLAKNGIFLTSTTAGMAWGLRNFLLKKKSSNGGEVNLEESFLVKMRNYQLTLGKFLRAEVGVFDTEPAGSAVLSTPYIQEQLEQLKEVSKAFRERFGYS